MLPKHYCSGLAQEIHGYAQQCTSCAKTQRETNAGFQSRSQMHPRKPDRKSWDFLRGTLGKRVRMSQLQLGRATAILLLLVAAWPPLNPATMFAGSSGAPVCCRRSGQRHCLMGAQQHSDGSVPEFGAARRRCPYADPVLCASFTSLRVSAFASPALRTVVLLTEPESVSVKPGAAWERHARGPPL